MSQIFLLPEEEFRQLLLAKLPPVIAGKDVERQLGGIITTKNLANADFSGTGPMGAFQVGRTIVHTSIEMLNAINAKHEMLSTPLKFTPRGAEVFSLMVKGLSEAYW